VGGCTSASRSTAARRSWAKSEPYVDTTSTFAFVGSSINVMMGAGWHDYSVPLDTAMTRIAGYDTKQVVLYGVHIGSGRRWRQPAAGHVPYRQLHHRRRCGARHG